jgi:hypothetical protein
VRIHGTRARDTVAELEERLAEAWDERLRYEGDERMVLDEQVADQSSSFGSIEDAPTAIDEGERAANA